MLLSFLRAVGYHNFAVRDVSESVLWDFRLGDEENSFCPFDVADALCKPADFVGQRVLPDSSVLVALDEVAVLHGFACDIVNDGSCKEIVVGPFFHLKDFIGIA